MERRERTGELASRDGTSFGSVLSLLPPPG
jgi:hypothetical protein